MKNFSIIIPSYKCKDFIEECLDSIENQSYFKNNNNFEILLGIDGCLETLEKFNLIKTKYRNIRCILLNKNYGLNITINTLLSLTNFENIIKFDCDDTMFNNLVEEVSENLDSDIILYKYLDYKNVKENSVLVDSFYYGSLYYNKIIFEKLGGYKNWICAADSELEKRINICNFSIKKINKPLFFRRVHSESLTQRKEMNLKSKIRQQYIQEIKKINEKTNIFVEPQIGEFEEIF